MRPSFLKSGVPTTIGDEALLGSEPHPPEISLVKKELIGRSIQPLTVRVARWVAMLI
jgi:hypothetical protein